VVCGLLKWEGELLICMGDEVENKSLVAHDIINGQWEYEV